MKLTKAKRIKYFNELGLEYNANNIKALKKVHLNKGFVNDKYDNQADILLRNLIRVKRYAPHFELKEFKCRCGKCSGYPVRLNVQLLKNAEQIRVHYGKPMTITCGIRCQKYNDSLQGSIPNSYHIKGKAIDFYMPTHTETLKQRKNTINYIKKMKGHKYAYCDGYNSNGSIVHYPNMGNCVHFEVK